MSDSSLLIDIIEAFVLEEIEQPPRLKFDRISCYGDKIGKNPSCDVSIESCGEMK